MHDQACATRLLTTLSHDVRTPLNAMMLLMSLFEKKHRDRLDDEDRADFAMIRADVQSILDIHEDMLRHASLAAGRARLVEVEFSLARVLSACADVVRPLAMDKGLGFDLDLQTFPILRSDRLMIQRLIGNLLSNAVRYTERGCIVLRSRLDECGLAIEVEDTGMGIALEDQGRIFDEYVRIAPSGDGRGLGLGLAMARLTADLLGASLTVRSEPGLGSTFTLTLPARIVVSRDWGGPARDGGVFVPQEGEEIGLESRPH